MKKIKNMRGITLIVLVVTIVVLLILAAVSIVILGGEDGIIMRVIESKEKTEIADEKEQLTETEKGQTNWGEISDKTELKVGDYINYIPDANTEGYTEDKLTEAITGSTSNTSTITQDLQYAKDETGMTWQILRIYADGSVDLIGSPTSQSVCFSGANGYNNGVTVMNDICETLYSRGTIKARSVNYEDIEYWLTDAGKTERDTYSSYSEGPKYGHTQTYMSSNKYYPNLYSQEIGTKIDSGLSGLIEGIDKETGNTTGLGISEEGVADGSTQASTSLTVTQTYWSGSMNSTNFGEGRNVLRTSNSYWVASRYALCDFNDASFGLRYVFHSLIGGSGISSSLAALSREPETFVFVR